MTGFIESSFLPGKMQVKYREIIEARAKQFYLKIQ
jgi:hypothetical protein